MTPFDLLFIALFLAALGTLAAAPGAALRGRPDRARGRLRRLGIGAVGYMAVVTLVSLLSPRRVVARGEGLCSDDWCIAVHSVSRTGDEAGAIYPMAVRISNLPLPLPHP